MAKNISMNLSPPLEADEERRCFERYSSLSQKIMACRVDKKRALLEQQCKQVRRAIFVANLRLVISIAKHYSNRGIHVHDLINEGSIGLLESIERFDYQRGLRFSTYATWRIRQSIIKSVGDNANTVRLPTHALYLLKKYRMICNELMQKNGKIPNLGEVSEVLNVSQQSIRSVLNVAAESSPEGYYNNENEAGDMSTLPDERCGHTVTRDTDTMIKVMLGNALKTLTERESNILKMRFGLEGNIPHTFDEISTHIGVTRERVRQIQKRALEKLRDSATMG